MPKLLSLESPRATIKGKAWYDQGAKHHPLVVGLHGGGFSSAYFEEGESLPMAAKEAGLNVVLLDRPGTRTSVFHRRTGDVLTDNAKALVAAIDQLWSEVGGFSSSVFLVGHSIGGAIALIMASLRPDWPLAGISVSGIGDKPPEAFARFGAGGPPSGLSRAALAALFLAPDAVSDDALDRMQSAGTGAVHEELLAVNTLWPTIVSDTLAAITAPVQLILAERETLWETGGAAIDRLDGYMTRAVCKDVALWPGVGHCIEYHAGASAAFLRRILQFIATR